MRQAPRKREPVMPHSAAIGGSLLSASDSGCLRPAKIGNFPQRRLSSPTPHILFMNKPPHTLRPPPLARRRSTASNPRRLEQATQAELADAADCHERQFRTFSAAAHAIRRDSNVCMVLGLDFHGRGYAGHGSIRCRRSRWAASAAGNGGRVAPIEHAPTRRPPLTTAHRQRSTLRRSFRCPTRSLPITDISWDPDWPELPVPGT